MKRKFITIHLLILVVLFLGCQKEEEDIVFDFSVPLEADFVEIDIPSSRQIILNANIGENQIQVLSASVVYKINADGTRVDDEGGFHSTSLSYFKKYCLSKNYLALSSMFNNQWISFYGIGYNGDFFFDSVNLPVFRVGADSLGHPYERYNYGLDNVAINNNDQTLLPVIKKSNSDEISFVIFNVKNYINSLNVSNLLLADDIEEITLPLETTTQLNRLETFQQNFYVSTNENTYMIRPNGTFKLLSEEGANDFFEYEGKIYADFGDRIGFTADDGETWEEKNNTPTFDGFREFHEVYGHLIFFFEDDLYLVDPVDFSFSSLKNKGLEGSKITAVLPFQQSIYVATLSGLFYKSIEELN